MARTGAGISRWLVLGALVLGFAGRAVAADPIVIGFSDSPPISSRDATTKALRGLAVSVFAEVATIAGLDMRPELMSFGDLLPSLTSLKIDVATMSATPERRKLAIFTSPFARYGEALLVRKEDAMPYSGLDQLGDKRVGSNAGGGWIEAARAAGAIISTYPGAEQSLAALERGEVDAVIGNAPTYVDRKSTRLNSSH